MTENQCDDDNFGLLSLIGSDMNAVVCLCFHQDSQEYFESDTCTDE